MMNWLWLGAAVVFGLIEAATAALVSVWFVGGAVAALLVSLLGGALWLQILLFLAVSAVILALTRPLVKKMAGHVQPTNLDQTIGASARVTEDAAGTGAVYVKGKMWTARSSSGATIPIGTEVTVERIEGVKLYVTPVRAETHRG